MVADVGTAASVRTADLVPPPLAVAPAVALVLLWDGLPPAAGAPEAVASAGPVLADGVPAADDDRVLPPPAGRLDDVVVLRWVVVLVDGVAGGFGLGFDGGRVLGALPAPKAQPSTLPAVGRYEPAPAVLYTHEPPGDACQ